MNEARLFFITPESLKYAVSCFIKFEPVVVGKRLRMDFYEGIRNYMASERIDRLVMTISPHHKGDTFLRNE